MERRPDSTIVLSSPRSIGTPARAVGEWLVKWAGEAPERVFLAERISAKASGSSDGWRRLTYGETLAAARRIGQALLDRGLSAEHPVAVLSGNSVDHALLALGAMHVGVPVVPISPPYSLMSKDFAKLKAIFALVRPGLVYAEDPMPFSEALSAIGMVPTSIEELLAAEPTSQVEEAFTTLGPDAISKVLFTSGSTGAPKGVINTQRMLTVNQEQNALLWPFVEDRPPVMVDWLPWNHTFGGNNNFNLVLRNGGTLYIDGGKPVPGAIETTVRNLSEIAPTMYFNVPRGFDLLMPFLESDDALRRQFFSRLEFVCYAGAGLPHNLWERFERLALAERNGELALVSAWGSTETAPLATAVHWVIARPGVIGLPAPGCELKLVPCAGKLEARVRGPNVTPGYYRRDDLTRAAFDEEGYYRIGDALKLADPDAPERGLVFDGRVAEDFKLTTGTWVHVGVVRVALIAAGDPLIQDAVITGHDRDEVGALLFLSPAAKDMGADAVRSRIAQALKALAAEGGSSTHPTRALVLDDPPSIDANEITDKGYINQCAVREKRAALVEKLYIRPLPPDVITPAP